MPNQCLPAPTRCGVGQLAFRIRRPTAVGMPVAAYLGPEEPDTVLHEKQTSILCNSLLNWQELARLLCRDS